MLQLSTALFFALTSSAQDFVAEDICSVLPSRTCWSNPSGKIQSVGVESAQPAICCQLCNNDTACRAWTHGHRGNNSFCDLFQNQGSTLSNKTSGCVSGVRSAPIPTPNPSSPNIVFLVVESTDGRTWQKGYQNDVLELPNIRELQRGGVSFQRHYANAPVCCPSRATFWSGRHAHKIPHYSNIPKSNLTVGGAWNNFEGLPQNYSDRIDQVLSRANYNVLISGKTDWSTGGHSENVRLNSWTMYTRMPYDIPKTGGWADETEDCIGNGTVRKGGGYGGVDSAHEGDWSTLKSSVSWLKSKAVQDPRPFFLFQGMNIVHPPYSTNEFWYNKIDPTKIDVPKWADLEDMHPCDLQSSMLKRCLPSNDTVGSIEDPYRRRNIRRIYAAMVAEFDDMVGAYMTAAKEAGVWNNTVFIVTSDHGDMQMEHRQFYKMVPRDPSASVPMVIYDGRATSEAAKERTVFKEDAPQAPKYGSPGSIVWQPTQLIDIFPTVMEYANVPRSGWPSGLDGTSLLPFLPPTPSSSSPETISGHVTTVPAVHSHPGGRDAWVTSQFHGCNIAMSWFMIVQQGPDGHAYKYIVWGTGEEVPPQLFDLTKDPSEFTDLLANETSAPKEIKQLVATLDKNLRSTIDYPSVAMQVATYNKDSFTAWVNNTQNWEAAIHASGLRWDKSWDLNPGGAIAAVKQWMAAPAQVLPCRQALVWPPPTSQE